MAADWLAKHAPQSNQDRMMQILGLKWAGVQVGLRETRTKELIALQRSDGGWAQTPYLASDAYATGQVLSTLHETGFSFTDHIPYSGAERNSCCGLQKEDGILVREEPGDEDTAVLPKWISLRPRSMDIRKRDRMGRNGAKPSRSAGKPAVARVINPPLYPRPRASLARAAAPAPGLPTQSLSRRHSL